LESILNSKKRRRSKFKFSLSHRLAILKNKFLADGGEFKECKVEDFFFVTTNPQLNKDSFVFGNTNKYPYFTRTTNNNGILGYVDYLDEEHKIKGNSIAVGMLGMKFYYMKQDFYAGQFTKTIFPKFSGLNEKNVLYFISWFNKSSLKFTSKLVRDFESLFLNSKIELPFYLGELSLDFMEKYIRELEAERIRELEAYLEASGLNDTILSEDENAVINKITNGLVKEFKIGDLFEKINLRFLKDRFDKSKDISKEQTKEFNLPLVNAKDGNNGIMYYGREEDFESVELSIDIVNDGAVSTGNVYPQPQKTGVLYNAYLIKLKNHIPSENTLIFFSATIEKSIKKKFGYDNKAGWSKVANEFIYLPITPNGNIDFDFMEKYIRAIEKKAIKGVVDWKDKVIAKTKEVVAFSDKDNRCIGL
jgi:hypothetical protein